MSRLPRLAVSLLDVRGRCNRRGLLVVASLLLAIEAPLGLAFWLAGSWPGGPLALALKLALFWIALAGCARRLHDLGRSAWTLAWAVPATIVWTILAALAVVAVGGLEALTPGTPWHVAATLLSMLPVVAGTLWLHVARGEPGANRYGAEPTGLGIATPVIDPAPGVTPPAPRAGDTGLGRSVGSGAYVRAG